MLASFDAAGHHNPANVSGWKDGWEARGVYVPKGV